MPHSHVDWCGLMNPGIGEIVQLLSGGRFGPLVLPFN